MKKLVSLLLAVCMCLSVGVVLTACDEEHEHTYKTEWSKDATHHWHACEGKDCTDVSDKAEHVWNEGEVTTEATAEADGEKTYTCTVCNATKGEVVEFAGVSENDWNEMLANPNFENYTLTQSQYVVYEGTGMQQDCIFKVAGDKASVTMTLDGSTLDTIVYTGEEAAAQKSSYEQIFRALLADFENFTYDKEENVYKTTSTITVEVPMEIYGITATIVMENAKVQLSDDGKLLNLECDYTQTTVTPDDTVVAETEAVWSFSDYGTTVVSEPTE